MVQSGFLNLCVVPEITIVEGYIEDIHLLFDDSVSTPVIPLTLGIPFQVPRVYSFEY